MPRARAIIIDGTRVLLIARQRDDRVYYVFPGGGIESGESAAATVRREVEEETGFVVEVEQLLAVITFSDDTQSFFLATVRGSALGTGNGPEYAEERQDNQGSYEPVWLPVDQLPNVTVYPAEIANLVHRSAGGAWPGEVFSFVSTYPD